VHNDVTTAVDPTGEKDEITAKLMDLAKVKKNKEYMKWYDKNVKDQGYQPQTVKNKNILVEGVKDKQDGKDRYRLYYVLGIVFSSTKRDGYLQVVTVENANLDAGGDVVKGSLKAGYTIEGFGATKDDTSEDFRGATVQILANSASPYNQTLVTSKMYQGKWDGSPVDGNGIDAMPLSTDPNDEKKITASAGPLRIVIDCTIGRSGKWLLTCNYLEINEEGQVK
jgi:hypothetical protein